MKDDLFQGAAFRYFVVMNGQVFKSYDDLAEAEKDVHALAAGGMHASISAACDVCDVTGV